MNQLEERNYYEQQDELDLLDLVRTTMKHKKMIGLVTILISLIILVGGYIYNKSTLKSSVVIALDYPGLEDGKNPNGTTFSSNELMPVSVVNKVFEKYKNEIKYTDNLKFRDSIFIRGIVPDAVKNKIKQSAEKGEKYTYIPTKYQIETKNNVIVLKNLALGAIENFQKEYKPNLKIDHIQSLDNYDYRDSYLILNNKLDTLKTIALENGKNNFVSSKLGYSFDTILSEIKSLQSIDLNIFNSYVTMNGFTLDSNIARVRYESEIKDLIIQKENLIEKAEVVRKMLADYKPQEKTFVLTNGGSINGQLDIPDDYYSKLIGEYLNLNKKIKDIQSEIRRCEEEKNKIKSPDDQEQEMLEKKVDIVVERANKIIDKLNALNKEYVEVKYGDMIKMDSPVIETTSGKPLYMYLAVGIILGLFTGIFFSFIAEFKEDYKKRYGK